MLFDAVPLVDVLLEQPDAFLEVDPTLFDAPDLMDLTVASPGRIPPPPDYDQVPGPAETSEDADAHLLNAAGLFESDTNFDTTAELVIVDTSVGDYETLVIVLKQNPSFRIWLNCP